MVNYNEFSDNYIGDAACILNPTHRTKVRFGDFLYRGNEKRRLTGRKQR